MQTRSGLRSPTSRSPPQRPRTGSPGALGTPNLPDEPPVVSAFAVRRLIACGLLTDLTANPVGDLLEAQDLLQTALLRTYRRWECIADK